MSFRISVGREDKELDTSYVSYMANLDNMANLTESLSVNMQPLK